MKTAPIRYGLLLATGVLILALSRPYEGLLLCLPVSIALGHWASFGKNRPKPAVLTRRASLPPLLLVAGAAWFGYYNYRAFGSPFTLPYTINRAAYAMAPYFVWQKLRPELQYRHAVMRNYYYETELKFAGKSTSFSHYLVQKLAMALVSIQFFAGITLLPPLIMVRRVFMDRRIRFIIFSVLVLMAGMAIQVFVLPHYLAPFTAPFYAIGLQAMRHLWQWRPAGKPAGKTLVRLSVTLCLLMAALRINAGSLHLELPQFPSTAWNFVWYGPDHFGTDRQHVEKDLERFPGRQLAIVRYSSRHSPFNE